MIDNRFAKRACCEDITKIENYEQAVNAKERWVCHHRLEHTWTKTELLAKGLYWARPADELIFMERKAHYKLHKTILPDGGAKERFIQKLTGHQVSEETKNKISDAVKRRNEDPEVKAKLINRNNQLQQTAAQYKEYKLAGGKMSWNEYQHLANHG